MTHCAQSWSEIVESGSPLGWLEFQAFKRPRIFSLKLAREFFNRIGHELTVARQNWPPGSGHRAGAGFAG
jgi:hypothetical protein